MTIIYRTTGAWGSGKGSPLTSAEVDGNFYDLSGRVTTLETVPPEAVSIDDITQTGSDLFIHMTDGNTFGPFTIDVPVWNFRGVWVALTNYSILDVFEYNGTVYQVIFDHTSAATFDPGANDGMGHNYYLVLLTLPADVLPLGGTTGQALIKTSDTDLDIRWATAAIPVGGTDGQLILKDGGTDYTFSWHDPIDLGLSTRELGDVSPSAPTDGQILVYNGGTNIWEPTDKLPRQPTISTNANTTYTLQAADVFTYVRFSNTSGCTVKIPADTTSDFLIGDEVDIHQATSAGVVTLVNDVGVTLNTPEGFQLTLLGEHATVTVKKVANNVWDVMGLLAPA